MDRKGITAVVAIVLLLMMTVAAAGLAYMWVGGLQKETQETGTESINKLQEQTSSSLSIDSLWSNNATNSSAGNMSFTLRNTGTVAFDDMSKFSIYVDGALIPFSTSGWGLSGAMAPSDVKTINTNISYPKVGIPKTIKVVTTNGIEAVKRCSSSSITQPSC